MMTLARWEEHKVMINLPVLEVEVGAVNVEATLATVVVQTVVEAVAHQWEKTSECKLQLPYLQSTLRALHSEVFWSSLTIINEK